MGKINYSICFCAVDFPEATEENLLFGTGIFFASMLHSPGRNPDLLKPILRVSKSFNLYHTELYSKTSIVNL